MVKNSIFLGKNKFLLFMFRDGFAVSTYSRPTKITTQIESGTVFKMSLKILMFF
jgi:hypothetical protein